MPILALITLILSFTGCAFAPRFEGMPVYTSDPAPSGAEPVPILIETSAGRGCNAVRIDAGTVATAAHCLQGASSVDVFEDGQVSRTASFTENPGFAIAERVVSAGADLAKLRVHAQPGGTRPVAIGEIQPGPVEIHTLTRAGARRVIPCGYLGRSGALVELSCAVDLGLSGAPVVQNGMLVGILSSRGQAQSLAIAQMADATRLYSF